MATRRTASRPALPPHPARKALGLGKWEAVLLFILILGGLSLRLYRLEYQSLWLDEGITVYIAKHLSTHTLFWGKIESADPPTLHNVVIAQTGGTLPLHLIILRGIVLLFGDRAAVARLFSVIVGTATLPVVYLIGKEQFSRKTAILGTLLLALSFFHVYYSREVRMYALVGFLSAYSYLLAIRLKKQPTAKGFALFTLVNALGLLTHYLFVFVMACHAALLCLQVLPWKETKKMAFSLAASSLPFAGLMRERLAFGGAVTYAEGPPFSMKMVANTFGRFLGLPGFDDVLKEHFTSSFLLLWMAVLALLLMVVFFIRKTRESRIWMPFLYVTLPFISYKVLEMMTGPVTKLGTEPRYFIIVFPLFLVLLAEGIACCPRPVGMGVLIILLLPSLISLRYYYTHPYNEDWRGVATYLSTRFPNPQGPGTRIIISPHYLYFPLSHYLPEEWPGTIEEAADKGLIMVMPPESPLAGPSPKEVVFVTLKNPREVEQEVLVFTRQFEEDYVLSETMQFTGIELTTYLPKPGR